MKKSRMFCDSCNIEIEYQEKPPVHGYCYMGIEIIIVTKKDICPRCMTQFLKDLIKSWDR